MSILFCETRVYFLPIYARIVQCSFLQPLYETDKFRVCGDFFLAPAYFSPNAYTRCVTERHWASSRTARRVRGYSICNPCASTVWLKRVGNWRIINSYSQQHCCVPEFHILRESFKITIQVLLIRSTFNLSLAFNDIYTDMVPTRYCSNYDWVNCYIHVQYCFTGWAIFSQATTNCCNHNCFFRKTPQ